MFDSVKEKMFGIKNSPKNEAIEPLEKMLCFIYSGVGLSERPLSTKLIANAEEGLALCRTMIGLLKHDSDENDPKEIKRLESLMESIEAVITTRK